jgi:spore coat polysaccharide biosynthesis predicted glycosyltransferase SpsG
MKVIILTEGGKNIGFGHLTRCIALYEAFLEKKIMPLILINADTTVKGLLAGRNYKIFNWLKEKDRLFRVIDNADIIIIDSYLAARDLYDKISTITKGKLVIVDDYNRLKYPRGIIVNPSIYGDKIKYPRMVGRNYLLGSKYIMLRKEFWSIPKKLIKKEVKNILITFGGMSDFKLANKIVGSLNNKFNFNFYFTGCKKGGFSTREMLCLMLKADICISGGGQTTYELARLGVPTIGICFSENQILNLVNWQSRGFIKNIGWYNAKNLLPNLLKSIDELQPYKERVRRSKIGRNFVDGNGVRRILRAVITKYE